MVTTPRIGVLGLQGGFAEHLLALRRCGLEPADVRTAAQLAAVDALVIPGGESTTMLKLLDRFGLRAPLVERIRAGMGVFGTCAGAIVLSSRSSDGEPPLGVLDVGVRRNAYGRQVESFEADVDVAGIGAVRGVFIRAPVFEEMGPGVEVLARLARNGRPARPVLVRAGRVLASAFHPELTGDLRLHRYFLSEVCGLPAARDG
ncbi:MAG: pyridoxal 5'-phosphate synthase glutaminase subunit PdxT [Actinomycetota bacterium]